MKPNFCDWIGQKREEAVARGGRAWTRSQLTAAKREYRNEREGCANFPDGFVPNRQSGEIVNVETGEVFTDCTTIGQLAETLGTTTAKLTDTMEALGLVDRVLTWKMVPMILFDEARKPQYYHTPEATDHALAKGLLVQVKGRWWKGGRGCPRTMVLITPKGREVLERAYVPVPQVVPHYRQRREWISSLIEEGRSASEIVRITGIPKRTVFRHLAVTRQAA